MLYLLVVLDRTTKIINVVSNAIVWTTYNGSYMLRQLESYTLKHRSLTIHSHSF